MCGIFGVWRIDGEPVDVESVVRSTNTLKHRGPNDEGYLLVDTRSLRTANCSGHDTDPHLRLPPIEPCLGEHFDMALGHRRLAILDLSPAGHQPMASADRSLWIVYNGEIYNYLELRNELRALGHTFFSGSDTEVVLAAYQQWGPECLHRFNGMWAFAIWDSESHSMFCARDRFGIRPFYYYIDSRRIIFASEIKAILSYGGFAPRPNEGMTYDYLALGVVDQSPATCFDGVCQLLPGHSLLLDKRHSPKVTQWYDMRSRVASRLVEPHVDAHEIAEFAALLDDAVRLRLRSDVPIGTCLSGGLDSSTIACIANKLMLDDASSDHRFSIGDRQKTFRSCFNDRRFDEREYIETVLEATGAEKNYVFPDGQTALWEELPQVIWHQEEPFGSTSIYAQWNVMRKASERGVTVLLDGQGGDELLAGYDWYYNLYLAELLRSRRLVTLIREATSIKAVSAGPGNLNYLAMGLLLALPLWLRPALGTIQQMTKPERKPVSMRVLNPSFATRHSDRIARHRRNTANVPRDVWHKLYLDTTLTSLPALLRYEDRNSAAFSLEARVPFLDYRVVEHVFSLPSRFKLREGWNKWLLRQAMAGTIPDKIRLRRNKMGFVTPETFWLRESRERVCELFTGKEVLSSPYLNPKLVKESLELMLSRGQIENNVVWRWINLELWLRRFFGA